MQKLLTHATSLLIFILCLLAPTQLHAQDLDKLLDGGGEEPAATVDPVAPVPAEFESPAATLLTFVTAMGQDNNVAAAINCLELEGSGVIQEKAEDAARDLYRILNRIELIRFDQDPTLLDVRADRIGDATAWVYFPRAIVHAEVSLQFMPAKIRMQLEQMRQQRTARMQLVQTLAADGTIELVKSNDGRWLFSAATVGGIESFWEQIKRLGPVSEDLLASEAQHQTFADRLESLWPASMVDNDFIGVKYWQWAMMLVLIMIGVTLDLLVRVILASISRRMIRNRGGEAKRESIKRTVRPFGLTAAGLLWLWTIHLLGLPNDAMKIMIPMVKLFAMLTTVWSAYRITDLLAEVAASKAESTRTKFDDVLVPLVRKAIKIFITVFGLIYIAGAFNVPIAPMLTGLGIGGVGFAFAARDTLENFFGSVTVIVDRPFEVGDWVVLGDVEGVVEELGFRSTRVRTFYNSLVTVPNGNLVRANVDNYGKRKYRRYTTHLNIAYDTTPDLIDAFCEGVREIIRFHPYTRKDYYQVWLHKFGPHSLDILMYMFFDSPDWNTELRERHRLSLDILRLADRLGVEFAYPTQTLHVRQQDSQTTEEREAAPAPDADSERRAHVVGRRAIRALLADAPYRHEKPGPHVIEHESIPVDPEDETQIESRVGGSAGE